MKNLIWIAALLISAQSALADERTPSSAGGEIRPDCNAVAEATTVLPSAPTATNTATPGAGEGRTAQ